MFTRMGTEPPKRRVSGFLEYFRPIFRSRDLRGGDVLSAQWTLGFLQ